VNGEAPMMGNVLRRRLGAIGAGLLLAIGSGTTLAAEAGAAAPKTTRVSVSSAGVQGNRDSSNHFRDPLTSRHVSRHGRFVAFTSEARNLIRRDTNRRADVFVHDRKHGTTRRVSVSSRGIQGDKESFSPSISANGRFVAFTSKARNLVPHDAGGRDIFIHDRVTGKTRLVSVSSAGTQAAGHSAHASISADGRFVAFHSNARNLVPGHTGRLDDIFVRDLETGETSLVSVSSDGIQADGYSYDPSISADGEFVVFWSGATNLVPGDTNGEFDVFVHERVTGETTRVSVNSAGDQGSGPSVYGPSLSADGRIVAFRSAATNLVAGDTNGLPDVFVHDRVTGETTRVSVNSAGDQGDDVSSEPSLSANGRFVAFGSAATNLVTRDTNARSDIYVHDRRRRTTRRASVNTRGIEGDMTSFSSAISADGRFVAFYSGARNLVRGDTNRAYDVFVRGPLNRGSR
jgi:Tol biopolymer transport system component